MTTKKNKTGRPTKFNDEISLAAQIGYENGYTDKQVSERLGIDEKTINNWKIKYPDFFQSLKAAKDVVDQGVEASLLDRANGYYQKVEKPFLNKYGEVVIAEYNQYFPKDTVAGIYWLKNRQPDKWNKSDKDFGGGDDLPKQLPQTVANVSKRAKPD